MMVHAQIAVDDTLNVYFRQNEKTFSPDLKENGNRMADFVEHFERLRQEPLFRQKAKIHIHAGCSPEGRFKANNALLQKRTESIKDVLKYGYDVPDSLIVIDYQGINWEKLTDMVLADPFVPYKEEVLEHLQAPETVVNAEGKLVEVRKLRLIYLRDGKSWEYMYEHFYPSLRHFELYFGVAQQEYDAQIGRLRSLIPSASAELMSDYAGLVLPSSSFSYPEKKTFHMGIRTNLLYDLLLTPNLGLDFYLGKRWSLGVDGIFAWWNYSPLGWYHRIYGGELELRRWFGKKSRLKPLQGWHIGLYGQALTYDFAWKGRGFMGDRLSYAAGLTLGYSTPVARRLNIDFSIGLGYFIGECQEYTPQDGNYLWKSTRQLSTCGPAEVAVSLVWLLGSGHAD